MRRSIAALSLAVLLVTAGCSAPLGLTGAPSDGVNQNPDAEPGGGGSQPAVAPADPARTIQVAASGTAEAEPDRAVVSVAVVARSDDISIIRDRLAANATEMREALAEAGIDAEQVVTTRYDIRQNYRYDPERNPDQPRYQGQHAFAITLNNTSRAGQTVVTALENGANRVEGVEFTLTEETRRDLRNEALAEAVEVGRTQAETAAEGTGLDITGVSTVETAETSVRPYRVQETAAFAAAGDGGGASTTFEGGTVTVRAQALVTYNATSTN
ncbi:SIMPL domain-containing protein [Haloglomus litoreum]|uniref:SIMPL domain-containing protein n=1 Tax=Haloglomus litoreum TaxID=3034026 RepID=UPI0023E8AE5B|nr:SIMPL domain-containing protein [Haloglomus sp. DT116]